MINRAALSDLFVIEFILIMSAYFGNWFPAPYPPASLHAGNVRREEWGGGGVLLTFSCPCSIGKKHERPVPWSVYSYSLVVFLWWFQYLLIVWIASTTHFCDNYAAVPLYMATLTRGRPSLIRPCFQRPDLVYLYLNLYWLLMRSLL